MLLLQVLLAPHSFLEHFREAHWVNSIAVLAGPEVVELEKE